MDQILQKKGLTFDQLKAPEKDWLISKVNALSSGQLTVEKIRDAVKAMRAQAEYELAASTDAPANFITLLTLLLPLVGIIRKWYYDQKQVEIKAKIKVLLNLENLLTSPEKRRKEINDALDNIVELDDDEIDPEG